MPPKLQKGSTMPAKITRVRVIGDLAMPVRVVSLNRSDTRFGLHCIDRDQKGCNAAMDDGKERRVVDVVSEVTFEEE